jgi:GMP synthase-like glutamine amidotransferase
MKLTILEAGRPPEALRATFPSYPKMFAGLIGDADPGFSFESVAVCDGEPLPAPERLEAVLITGSPAGVYDPLEWIAPLEDFIRRAAAAGTPQVGICFGHQIMAQAFGGRVVKSDKGWGVGRHAYEIVSAPSWMDPPRERFAVAASHQDQVVAPPPGADVIARSPHTDYAALAYPQARALSFQGHPEMSAAFAAALIEARRGARIADEVAAPALESLALPMDSAIVARWIARFLRGA